MFTGSRKINFSSFRLQSVLLLAILPALFNTACEKKEEALAAVAPASKYLYIATGACYVGGLTAESYSRRVSRVNLSTGVLDSTIADYNSAGVEYPVGLVSLDNDYIAVLVENATGRRVDKVNKKRVIPNSEIQTYIPSNAGLSSVNRAMIATADGGLLISRSSAIERYSSSKARVVLGASNPWGNITAGACLGSNTLITAMAMLSNGKVVFTHAAASPNNRMGVITSTGFSTGTDCAATAAPSASYYPTAMIYIPSKTVPNEGQLLVGYSPNAAATIGADAIIAYDVNETTGAITLVGDAFRDATILKGISAMAYDSASNIVYAANGSTSQGNTIEKFSWNPTTKTLTRLGGSPFVGVTADSKCITSMTVAY